MNNVSNMVSSPLDAAKSYKFIETKKWYTSFLGEQNLLLKNPIQIEMAQIDMIKKSCCYCTQTGDL